MKFRTITILFLISLSVFLIYIFNKDKKVYYVDIKDKIYENKTYDKYINNYIKQKNIKEKYISSFSNNDYRITELIRDINENKSLENNNITIQNVLIKADVLTIKMGDSELDYKINTSEINELFDYCDNLIDDIDELFILLRKFCKEKIYFIGLHNYNSDYYDEIYDYLNLKIADTASKYDIIFISSGDLKSSKVNKNISNNIIKDYLKANKIRINN